MVVSLITGAGSGIGRATAILLASRGHSVVLVGRREESLRETQSILGAGARALMVKADVGDAVQARSAVDKAVAEFGRLDNLVNNAGVAPLLDIDKHTPEVIEEVFRINALGPANLIARAWPVFVKQRGGCIVNVSSVATVDPFPGFFGYAAAKAGVNLMARSCANEGKEFGIRAFAVAPGAVETGMLRKAFSEEKLPRSQTMAPEVVARVIVECVEGKKNALNGDVIIVDQGAA